MRVRVYSRDLPLGPELLRAWRGWRQDDPRREEHLLACVQIVVISILTKPLRRIVLQELSV
ncbi:hypothetical protein J2848_003160 [Azospirillum lipoferum]|uniref:Uncharacterized protein n=1 Tax=Azospirillum lipoferum TaxID=193 RepID=A0A5A9GML9_AZOLI|nr:MULTISPECIES: hypothetical protein [Azospirillum]KAA0595651.1 hypothetical protein FZ942_14730 [Azospirillum lipoferum]MCP1611487.1 hypothetical protein [Azospirillum lipoferum]MDW5537288.1 hypothetical protein [Azospirillum sp. NL1]